jgi:transcriptional regulator with GAF, ATPase, and Fis domain
MATVFLVEEERRGQTRVLKQLRLDQPELLDAFHSEFSLLSRVTHPHLTRVHDFASFRLRGELYHYYTADFVEGVTLAESVRAPGVDFTRPLLDALDGLAALHELGMRHGDFTPDNVLVRPDGRGTLIDLGCARAFGQRSLDVAGTPGFLAPELLRDGAGDARADLYALGATLRFCQERARLPLNSALAKLSERLLSVEPARRPQSVEEVLDELGSQTRGGALLRVFSRCLLGRDREIASFTRFLADAREARPGPRVLRVCGPSGSGSSRLIGELAARAELEQRVIRAHASEANPVRWLLATASGARELGTGARDVLSVVALASALEEPILLVLEDAERLEPGERDLLLSFARSLEPTGALSLLISGAIDLFGIEVESLELAPLDIDALAAWTRGSLSRGALERLRADSGGLPAQVEVELGRLARARGASAEPALASTSLARIAADVNQLSASERQSLALLLALAGELDADAWSIPAEDFASALSLGLVRRERALLRLSRRTELEPLALALGGAPLREAHRQIAQLLQARALPNSSEEIRHAELVRHLCLAGEHEAAARALRAAEPLFRAEPRVLCARVEPLLFAPTEPQLLLLVAELCLLAGELHLALRAIARALLRCKDLGFAAKARLLAADALLRLGRADRAERVSRRVLAADLANPERARAYELLARASLQRQEPAAAEQAARAGLLLDPEPKLAASLREVLGLAAGYLGRTSEAEGYFAEALRELGADAPPREVCRVLGQRAIVAFRAGRAAEAALDHARALSIAERHALDDLVCVSSLNLGTAEQQLGDLGAALRSYERGLAVARPLGRESTELTLRYNLANLRAEISDFAGAERELASLERRAGPDAWLRFEPVVALVRAELALGRGALDECEQELDRARVGFEQRQLERELCEVEIVRGELELARSAWSSAQERAERCELKASELRAADLAIRAAGLAARAALGSGDASAFARLELVYERAAASGQRLLEAKLAGELAAAALRSADSSAAERAERARRLWDRLGANLPEALRGSFWSDARRAHLERRTRRQAQAAPQRDDAEALRRLLSLSRRLNSTLSLERVLDYAVQAAVELTTAERGFVLLAESADDVRVAAQHGSSTALDPPSRGIVGRVLASEEAVLTTDAQTDERFVGRGSVHALRLKSVLCVPISTPSGRLGALYVDSRVQRGRFQESDRELLLALADHVAFALSNARLHAELELRAQQIEDQRRSLERLSRSKDRELERLRERVEEQQRALGLRYDYSRIIGRSPSMRRLLSQLDRIIDSDASVLVHGESGTGKELIARAIHGNGARAGGAFVAVNCAALPQALIESELFGHQRGAFTGADRDKKGLMLEANGGTLFLDEIAELPLLTQAKLLRVLQERELRPVGATRSLALDLRLVCASHRELMEEVSAGRFREDLFYRIAVVSLELPPLRERAEDIPELAHAILTRLAKDAGREPVELAPEALRLLMSHSFPGNVRELENVLTRAFVLGRGGRITASDLGLLRQPARRRRSLSRSEFEAEDRERILETLRQARWNVSEVSRLLGVPRNTLYRKLERYGLNRRE